MKRFSYKKIYFRDNDGVMKKLPGGLLAMIDNKKRLLVKVYTLSKLPGYPGSGISGETAMLLELPLE